MLRVYSCIVDLHDLRILGLAVLVCLLGSIAAVGLVSRALHAERDRSAWITVAAIVTGGSIWATHFVAMLAYEPHASARYDLGLTGVSFLIAVLPTWIGLALVVLRPRYGIWGGSFVGGAIGMMHFVGMAALESAVPVTYDPFYVAASLAIGIALAAPAFGLQAGRDTPGRRGLAAFCLAAAICGLHFTGMAAVDLQPLVEQSPAGGGPDREWIAFSVAIVVILILAIGIAGATLDQMLAARAMAESRRLREHVADLERTQASLQQTANALAAARDAAEAANLAKSQFLATMSHELRTPLNAVIGFSELIAGEVFGPIGNDRYRDYAQDIRTSGAHLLGLINDILDLAKLDADRLDLRIEDLDIVPLTADVLQIIRPQAHAAGHMLEVEIAADAPRLRADAGRVRQILLNLIGNAIKFTPAPGRIRIDIRPARTGAEIRVSDNGIGISAEDIPKALERFGQVDSTLARRFEGSGLGLPIAKRLAEAQGGHLYIASTLGQGTTVTVALPAAA